MVLLAGASVAVLLATACGSRTQQVNPARLRRGQAVFQHSCTGCHTLTGHDTRAPGGDLAIANLSTPNLLSFVRTMPIRPPLSTADAEAVAAYVHSAAQRQRP